MAAPGEARQAEHQAVTTGALRLADYSGAMVNVACRKCSRSGRLRRSRLEAVHGADIVLPELLARIAADCPKMRALGTDRCGAYFPDLAGR